MVREKKNDEEEEQKYSRTEEGEWKKKIALREVERERLMEKQELVSEKKWERRMKGCKR